MNNELKSQLLKYAASLTNGRNLKPLIEVCKNQKTISTRKLSIMLEDIEDRQKLEAVFLRKVFDSIAVNKEGKE